MARPSSQRVNLACIAERLGVSISTVSRALRNQDGIHPETGARILGLAHQMGYAIRGETKKPAAPETNALRHVLVLSQTSSPHIDQRYMAGMSGAAVSSNVAILSHLVAEDQCESVLDPKLAPASIRAGLVKGIVLLHRWPDHVAAEISRKFPTVSIVYDYPDTESDLIGIDDRRGVSELITHLHEAGHEQIGFFGLCPQISWSCARYAAWIEALTRRGLPTEPKNVVRIDLRSALASEEFPSAAWASTVRARMRAGVTAWVCASSMTGRTLCRFLREEGLRMPEDISLVSYHGGSYPRANDLPVITTTDVVDEELGAAAVRRLVNRLENPGESRRSILVPARLLPGATTLVKTAVAAA